MCTTNTRNAQPRWSFYQKKKQQVIYCLRLWKHLTGEENACFLVDHIKNILDIPAEINAMK